MTSPSLTPAIGAARVELCPADLRHPGFYFRNEKILIQELLDLGWGVFDFFHTPNSSNSGAPGPFSNDEKH
jgi:hypothetical protein